MEKNNTYKILDTNIILSDASSLLTLASDATIILPETVIHELDSKKSGFDEINFQAREFARIMTETEQCGDVERTGDLTITNLTHGSARIKIVSKAKYEAIDEATPLNIVNDQRIIATAKACSELYSTSLVTFMSLDLMCRISARAVGLHTSLPKVSVTDESKAEFTKEMLIEDPEVFRTLHNTEALKVDPDHIPGNYSYKFTCSVTNQMKLATVSNGFISVVDKEVETHLRKQRCAPINADQLLAAKAVQDPTIDLVLIEGPAGSGKNITALSNAIKLLETNKDKYDSIVYFRAPINDESDKSEAIGYLSTNESKLGMYLGPLQDTVDFVVRQSINTKNMAKEEIEAKVEERTSKLISDCGIEARITTGERGLTYHNSVVWIDEASSMSPATMQKMLTRVGKNCKVIITGSYKQIDHPYLNRWNNSLAVLMDEAYNRNIDSNINMFSIALTKVVRSDMVDFAEKLFSKS